MLLSSFLLLTLKLYSVLLIKKIVHLLRKKLGKIKEIKVELFSFNDKLKMGGGEDRTRLSQIMSLVHSPDCYTPKEIHVILITLNFNIQYKNNISKNTLLGSFCEISFFSSTL